MATIQMATTDGTYSNFLAIMKIPGSAVKLFDNKVNVMSEGQSLRILLRDLENRSTGFDSGLQVFVLDKPSSKTDSGTFQNQKPSGQELYSDSMAIFMTKPTDNTKELSFAIDIGISKTCSSMEDLSGDEAKKVGTAYLYLKPKFSTQGIQRMQILSIYNKVPIGHIQVEYLIVTNPIAYGAIVPRPKWLSPKNQLDAGHRGAGSGCRADLPGSITENTVASFNYAAEHGADMCELDVMCTADGVPVVFHNYTLNTNEAPQIDELTLNELRALGNITIHDANCKHEQQKKNGNISQGDSTNIGNNGSNSRPFPTLEEVLRDVVKDCALNIELKWAQLLPNGQSEATQYREINDFVDRILSCIVKHSNGRPILLSTLNADIAVMLRLKQSQYPVLFLTTGDSQRFNDPSTKSVKTAIHFAHAFDLAGINPNAAKLDEYLVRYAKDRGLLVYAWGKIESPQAVKELRKYGLNGVIYDKIDLIKPQE